MTSTPALSAPSADAPPGSLPSSRPLPARLAWVGSAALAVVAGLLTWWSFPGAGPGPAPTALWWAAAPGVALLLLALRGRRPVSAGALGLVYGVAFLLPHLSWAGEYVGWLPLAALVALETLFYGAGAILLVLVSRHRVGVVRVVGSAGVWVAVEAARARVPFGGFGWGRLAFSQADGPTLGLAALGGAALVGFAVAVQGALLAEAVLAFRFGGGHRRLASAAAVVAPLAAAAAVLVSGLAVPLPTSPQEGTLRVAGVQGNVPRAGLEFNAERRAVLDNHAGATRDLAARVTAGRTPPPDLVVWPENASDIDPLRNADAARVIDEAVDAVDAPVMVGTLLRDSQDQYRNTTIVWEPGSGPGQQYVKRHPVPFAEYVPYRAFFRQLTAKVDLVRADMVAGDRVGVLDVAGTRVGDLICFEVVDDGLVADTVRHGARLVVVQTNNATFGYTDESVQQLAMSRVRAVEHGRSVAHVSTVGVSALIAPDGRVLTRSGLFTRDVLEADLPLRSSTTVATRVGEWPELVLAGAGILAAAAGMRRPRKGRRG